MDSGRSSSAKSEFILCNSYFDRNMKILVFVLFSRRISLDLLTQDEDDANDDNDDQLIILAFSVFFVSSCAMSSPILNS